MASRPARMAIFGNPRSAMRNCSAGSVHDDPTAGQTGSTQACDLCQRESLRFTNHHLVPRSRGGKSGPKARLCPTCHRQLHAMFSEATLAKELNSIATLRANPEVASYLNWARRQKGPTNFRVRRANNRR